MKTRHFVLLVLFGLCPFALPAAINIEPPIDDWASTNPTAIEGTDYRFEVSNPNTLQFNYNARVVYNSSNPLSSSSVGEGYMAAINMTPVYSFQGGSGGIIWLEDYAFLSTQETAPFVFGSDYLSLRYSYTGITATNQIFLEANDSSGNTNITLAQGFNFNGTLLFDVRLDYTDSSEWTLSGTISDQIQTLWDSSVDGVAIIDSAVLANDADDSVYFGAFDPTQIGSASFSKLSGSFGAVPEPATLGLLLGLLALFQIFIQRK